MMIRNLGEATTYDSLRRALGEHFGPVKRVDVIRGRGFGFVRFASREDAKKAIAAARSSGVDVDGASVEIEMAREKQKAPKPVKQPVVPKAERARSIRVWGLTGASEKRVYKRVRKLEGFEALVSFAEATAVVRFASLKAATAAAKRLDGATIKGATSRARLEIYVKPQRLIVRNLKFTTEQSALREAFEPYGPLKDVSIVSRDGESRGFGFVEFYCKNDAQSALGAARTAFRVDGREVAVDPALGKDEYRQTLNSTAGPAPAQDVASEGASMRADDHAPPPQDDDAPPPQDDDAPQQDDDDDAPQQDDDDDNDSPPPQDDDDDDDPPPQDDDGPPPQDDDAKKGDAAEGRTAFVRNLPYGSAARLVRSFFEETVGSVESCHLVKDKETGLPRGSAFVKFGTSDSVEKALGEELEFEGRKLRVSLALVEGVETPELAGPSKRRKLEATTDKRRLDLVDEGLVARGTPAARDVPASELAKRETSRAAKKRKLSNPLFFVNPTRLSLRNLNHAVDDKTLRKLCKRAKSVKVVTDDAGKSKGYGFAEFEDEDQALDALRRLNNNPSFTSYAKPSTDAGVPRLIVEMTVENKLKADQRAANVQKARASNENKKPSVVTSPPAKKQKKTKQTTRPQPTSAKVPKPAKQVSVDAVVRDVKAAMAEGLKARWFEEEEEAPPPS